MDSTLLAKRLKDLWLKHGLTQYELGNYLNITQQGYFYYENGKHKPDLTTLKKIADLYGMTLSELISPCLAEASPANQVAEDSPDINSLYNTVFEPLPNREKTFLRLFSKLSPKEKNDFIELIQIKLQQNKRRNKKN